MCKIHGTQYHKRYGKAKYPHCSACKIASRAKIRQEFKKRLVEHFGGCCEICGYNKSIKALEFHHKDPKTKSFEISSRNITNYAKLLAEALKCILICANCHRELH